MGRDRQSGGPGGRLVRWHAMRWVLAVLLGATVGLTGCSFAPRMQAPAPATAVPDAFVHADTAGAYMPLAWWEAFGDPVLNRLVDSTLTSNLDLVEAVARVAEVEAQYRIERAALLPGVQATANASYQDQPANSGFGAQFSALAGGGDGTGDEPGEPPGMDDPLPASPPSRIDFSSYSASLGMAYEIDFWGRIRNSTRAALRTFFATQADLEAARLAVLNQAISTYFEVVDLRRRIALNVETIDLLTERVDRTEERYDRGLVSSFELYLIRQDYRTTQASLPQLERQHADAESRLAVIVGAYAGQLGGLLGDTLAPRLVTDAIPTGLPAALLAQRPDVRAAAERMEAARYLIGARKAELYPTITPSGSLGLQSSAFGDLFDLNQWFVNLAAGLTAPLFQGGRLRAGVDAAEARYIQQAAAYTRTLLTAYREAESALAAFEEERQRYAFLRGQRDEAAAAVDLQAGRFERGVGEYLDYLDALRTLLNVETTLAAAERDLALARLGVHRALGGGWTDAAPTPTLPMVLGPVPGTQE